MSGGRVRGVPPGRAGRNWLRRRLGTARRGREQLDRKLRVLLPEQQRLRLQAARRRDEWVRAHDEASTWVLRAVLLGGEDALRRATADDVLRVAVTWTTSMGVSYPVEATLVGPDGDARPAPGNAAVVPARSAVTAAVTAGARLAVAEDALRRVGIEVDLTRRRLRALDKRVVPALEEALATLGLALEQDEQEEGVRLRLAADHGVASVGVRPRPGGRR